MKVKKKSAYTAAIYLRLSKEDGDKPESDSIQNQRDLIRGFLEKHPEIISVKEFVDDGYTGTNFDRPAFSKMMGEIERGKIDCIIVKDLSRLGRNYIETGRYLDRVFPLLEVRFIAINDSYDNTDHSTDTEDIIIPFKNLINDSYCRDISVKIRSQLDTKRKKGKFIGSFAPFGYVKDPKDHNHLVIDAQAAEIVKRIFDKKMQGYSSGRIAEELNEIGVLTPMSYKRASGQNFDSGYRVRENPKWIPRMVTDILTNEVYTGTMVQGKKRKINYKIKVSRPVEKSDWIRVDNTHTPIISREVFDTVQQLLLKDTRTAPGKNCVDIFSGLLVCADCGQSLVRKTAGSRGKVYYYYHCSTYKKNKECSSHLINADKLYETVLCVIQKEIDQLIETEALLCQMERLPEKGFHSKMLEEQKQTLKRELDHYREMKFHLYQDMADQVISREEYKDLNIRFDRKIKVAEEAMENLLKKSNVLKQTVEILQPWIQDLKQYKNLRTLDRKILVSIVDQIIVYDKDRIEIKFRHRNELQEILDLASANY